MSGLKKVVLCLVCLLLPASTLPAQRLVSGKALPSRQQLNRHGLEMVWWGQAMIDPAQDRVRHVTLDEQVVVVQSKSGSITAFDHETGRRLWAVHLGRRIHTSHAAAINDTLVVFPIGLQLYAVEKFTGKVAWQINLPTQPSTSPTMDEERVYIGSLGGTIYAYNLKKIRELHEEAHDDRWSFLALDWKYNAGNRITTAPLSNETNLAFSTTDGLLYSVMALDHSLRFQFESDYPVSAPLGLSEGLLYVITDGFKIYCINSQNGRIFWEFIIGVPIHQRPYLVDEQLFLSADNGSLFCLSKKTREQYWMREKIGHFLAANGSNIYASDNIGNVLMISRTDGAIVGSLPLRKYPIRPVNDRTDRLFVVSEKGRVLCIREQGRDYPIFHKFPERRPIQPEFAPEDDEIAEAESAPADEDEN